MDENTIIEPVKLITGFIYRDIDILTEILENMENIYSPVNIESEHTDFGHTSYYEKEMGPNLSRLFVSFEETVMPDKLVEIKQTTNSLEQKYLNESGGRLVNIDPGFVSLSNLILASTKDYSHRIYLGGCIYGEITLIYKNRKFEPLEWTYPDYKTPSANEFLLRVREALKEHIILIRQN